MPKKVTFITHSRILDEIQSNPDLLCSSGFEKVRQLRGEILRLTDFGANGFLTWDQVVPNLARLTRARPGELIDFATCLQQAWRVEVVIEVNPEPDIELVQSFTMTIKCLKKNVRKNVPSPTLILGCIGMENYGVATSWHLALV